MNVHVHSMCLKCPPPARTQGSQMVTPVVDRSVDDVLVKVKSSLLQVVDVMNLCFIQALLYNTPNK